MKKKKTQMSPGAAVNQHFKTHTVGVWSQNNYTHFTVLMLNDFMMDENDAG